MAECQTNGLRQLLIEISQDMTVDELDIVKFYLDLPRGIAAGICKPVQLWPVLADRDHIDYGDQEKTLQFLEKIFNPVNFRGDKRLIKHVRVFRGEPVVDNNAADVVHDGMDTGLRPEFHSLAYLLNNEEGEQSCIVVVKILQLDEEQCYTNALGIDMCIVRATVADVTDCCVVQFYCHKYHRLLRIGRGIKIMSPVVVNRTLLVRSQGQICIYKAPDVPKDIEEKVECLDKVMATPIKDILGSSDDKKRWTVIARITQDSPPVMGPKKTRRSIVLTDGTGSIDATLWAAAAATPVGIGDKVRVSNVAFSTYLHVRQLNVNPGLCTIKKITNEDDDEPTKCEGTIDGIVNIDEFNMAFTVSFVTGASAATELLLPAKTIQSCLEMDERGTMAEVEDAICTLLPLHTIVTIRDGTIVGLD